MDECKIIKYTDDYKDELWGYLRKTYPHYSGTYIDYCIQQVSLNSDEQSPILVLNGQNRIVGCNLYFNTKARILGVVRNVWWSYNTFLDAEYRKKIGLDFMLDTMKTNSFGIGLSDVNRKIQKKSKARFWDGLYNCFFVSWSIPFVLMGHLLNKENRISEIGFIKTGKTIFERVSSSSMLNIPNEGFWYGGCVDIEFVRDKNFFDYRFLNNKVYNYSVYRVVGNSGKDSCYFVVRPFMFKGVPALFLVDFRYDMKHPEYGKLIVMAANKLARKSKMGGVFCMTNDPHVSSAIERKWLHFKTPNDLLAPKSMGIKPDMSFFVTAADSDADFLR